MECLKKRLKKNRGFTLVEIIVVLVILAILAAFTIPSMLGFVADAKGKAYIAEAREVYVAAQAVATEYSGVSTLNEGESGSNTLNDGTSDGSVYYGLTNSLGSTRVRGRYDAWNNKPTAPEYNYARVRASRQMYNYLEKDITISSLDLTGQNPNFSQLKAGESAWTVTVGTDPTKQTAKVTKVVYYKNHYKVTIAENNATVEKY